MRLEQPRNSLKRSTLDLIERVNRDEYPSLPQDSKCKDALVSAFRKTANFKKYNRPDVNSREQLISPSLTEEDLLGRIRQRYKEKIFAGGQEKFADQSFIAEQIASTYEDFKDNPTLPAYCGEMTYLLYYHLREEGIKPENMLVVGFSANAEDHVLLMYSSDEGFLEQIKNDYFEQEEEGEEAESYKNFIELCARRDKNQTLLLLDPWSQDNKILDLNQLDRDESTNEVIEDYFKNKREALEEGFQPHAIIDGVLEESRVSKATGSVINMETLSFQVDAFKPEELMEIDEENTSDSSEEGTSKNRFRDTLFSNVPDSSSDSENEQEREKKELAGKTPSFRLC
ncbi:Dot/Icm T4SS effector CpeE [Coxiella burnetii]|uniref:Protein CbhE n=1 Tax=Coxiella burnetii (strain RSA 493 / Nine Mile phase I) TaxID=227377 RepID=CBHE_COXBU|nr:Dot/Icm T4SS effector CpeE [Coxiella burnetii]NP_819033.1 CbhE [Coxiella burnetii RSA 493]P26688.2 RecName: Full=Protein CbhE [Coxiella burnetii RSA 493]AAO91593.1 CbhE [Coxiella burnetii RSA 493]ARI66906.1 protein CbhE [Coxiella burnetii]ARK28370.1 hypothetical protein BMW92_10580 [Coxiella burnetii]MCF2094052.1 Dot/Icm T4SS effector CpeE [Coxiella burnetii]MCF2096078.1 Dot/Icm T4SS effector CpeE [Coxiella burnetii]